jgi:hypothetical protein
MGNIKKKAEMSVADAEKFPIESLREKLARRYGLDAVALSGPCEGAPIVDCVCDQLSRRWDRLKKRFARNGSKVEKLAMKLAKSFLEKDDSEQCVADLKRLGFEKAAAEGITDHLKAFHLNDEAMDDELNGLIEELGNEDKADDELSGLEVNDEPEVVEDDDLFLEDHEDHMVDDPNFMEEEEEDISLPPGSEEGMVTIELPAEVAKELVDAIEGYEHEIEGDDEVEGFGNEGFGDEGMEILDMDDDSLSLEDNLPVSDDEPEIPGEEMKDGKQVVESNEPAMEEIEEGKSGCGACASSNKNTKEAGMLLRAGQIRRQGQSVLKVGPEMSINNTDQQAGGKDLGKAKEKAVEDPKAISDGNCRPEGYMANGEKIQDGKPMGREEAFKAHELTPDEVSGGKKSLLGKDESYPEGKPEVPAGSAPIGGEEYEGGNVSTKGTVIATLVPDGIICQAKGHDKSIKVKVEVKSASADLVEAIGKIPYDGDLKKFALAAARIIKAKCKIEDGVCKTNTSKLEADKFTNDGEKKPADGGAVAGKKGPASKEEVPTTNTSKLESEKFTNDADKKPEGEKAAKSEKNVRTAGDKKVEDPKPLDKGNIKPEGYMAGDGKLSSGDGSVQGSEEKFTAHEIEKSEVSVGESSLLGQDESLPTGKAEVPAGGGQIGNEELTGGDVSTKGTVIAETQGAVASEVTKIRNENHVREARLKAASALLADQMRHGEVTEKEYVEKLEQYAQMDVPAIQALGHAIRETRKRIEARATAALKPETKQAGLGIPVVHDVSREGESLKDRLSRQFSINSVLDPDSYDANGRKKRS